MHRQQLFDTFQFKNYFVLDHHIHSKSVIKMNTLIVDWQNFLTFNK